MQHLRMCIISAIKIQAAQGTTVKTLQDICGTSISFGLVGSGLLIGQREALVGQEGDGLRHSLPSGAAGFTTHGSREDKGNQREINMKSARHQLETC